MNSQGPEKSFDSEPKPGPTVFVVDDDLAFCDALKWLIESDGLVAETYPSPEAFFDAITPDRPGCVVLDLRLPGMSGLEVHEQLTRHQIRIPVIIITAYGTLSTAVRAMKGGALDVFEKPVNDEVLLARIREAITIDAERRVRESWRQEVRMRVAELTPREHQIMDLVVAGNPNKRIAADLGVSEKTVEVHRKRVMKKLKVKAAVDLVRIVMTSGVLDEPD